MGMYSLATALSTSTPHSPTSATATGRTHCCKRPLRLMVRRAQDGGGRRENCGHARLRGCAPRTRLFGACEHRLRLGRPGLYCLCDLASLYLLYVDVATVLTALIWFCTAACSGREENTCLRDPLQPSNRPAGQTTATSLPPHSPASKLLHGHSSMVPPPKAEAILMAASHLVGQGRGGMGLGRLGPHTAPRAGQGQGGGTFMGPPVLSGRTDGRTASARTSLGRQGRWAGRARTLGAAPLARAWELHTPQHFPPPTSTPRAARTHRAPPRGWATAMAPRHEPAAHTPSAMGRLNDSTFHILPRTQH